MTPLFFTMLIACQNSDEAKDNSQPTTQGNTAQTTKPPENPVSVPSVKGLPNLLKGIVTDGCDNGPGVYGAADYFHNILEISSSGNVTGTETWILYANKKLFDEKWSKEDIPSPCKITWSLKGKTQDAVRGDLGLSLTNNLIDTTCPKEVVNKYTDTNQKINYSVVRKSDGTAKVFFASGKEVGQGHHKDGKLQFITNKSCRWF